MADFAGFQIIGEPMGGGQYIALPAKSGASWVKNQVLKVTAGELEEAAAGDATDLVLAAQDYPDAQYEGSDTRKFNCLRLDGCTLIGSLQGAAQAAHVFAAANVTAIGYDFGVDANGHNWINAASTPVAVCEVLGPVGQEFDDTTGGGEYGDTDARVRFRFNEDVCF